MSAGLPGPTSVGEEPGAPSGIRPEASPEQSDDDMIPGGHVGPWFPETVRDVEWLFSRAGDARQEIAQVQESLEVAVAELNRRAAAMTERANRTLHWAEGTLEEWAKRNRDAVVHGKVKSREFLGGALGFRSAPEKVTVVDEAAFLAWAQPDHLDLLRFPEPEVAKKALDRFVLTTGEIPPGVEVLAAKEAVHVKTNPLPMLGSSTTKALP